ncbi:hypothetical protein [Delftia sp. DLF01]|uniref:hypothetical protein n=1 Tax=Delftia sp. DLF01 TaxID=2769279 RepID=UPI001CE1627E|nr:hypothetical protein [Delftia sp. DLF01]
MVLFVELIGKLYYCPLKSNRQVGDSAGALSYRRVDELRWDAAEQARRKTITIRGLPRDHEVKLFRVVVSTSRTD